MGALFLAIFGVVMVAVVIQARRVSKAWMALPTLVQYWLRHPASKTATGPRCWNCGSRSFRSWGLLSAQDSNRSVSCRNCGTVLYRI